MVKITLVIKDKDKETCTIDLKMQKDLSKSSKTEINTAQVVYSEINETLLKLNQN